jgi:hypothetical protein
MPEPAAAGQKLVDGAGLWRNEGVVFGTYRANFSP